STRPKAQATSPSRSPSSTAPRRLKPRRHLSPSFSRRKVRNWLPRRATSRFWKALPLLRACRRCPKSSSCLSTPTQPSLPTKSSGRSSSTFSAVNPLPLSASMPAQRHREVALSVFSRFTGQNAVLVLLTLLVGTIAVAPLGRLALSALLDGDGFAVERLTKLFSRPQTSAALVNTLIIATLSTIASLVIGVVFAVVMVFPDLRHKSALVFAFVLPLMIPPQVTAMAWIQAFSPSSPVLGMLGM